MTSVQACMLSSNHPYNCDPCLAPLGQTLKIYSNACGLVYTRSIMGHAVDKADLHVFTVYCGLFGANQHSTCSYLLMANLIWGPWWQTYLLQFNLIPLLQDTKHTWQLQLINMCEHNKLKQQVQIANNRLAVIHRPHKQHIVKTHAPAASCTMLHEHLKARIVSYLWRPERLPGFNELTSSSPSGIQCVTSVELCSRVLRLTDLHHCSGICSYLPLIKFASALFDQGLKHNILVV